MDQPEQQEQMQTITSVLPRQHSGFSDKWKKEYAKERKQIREISENGWFFQQTKCFKIRLSVPTSSVQICKMQWRMQEKIINTILHNRGSGKTWGHIYTVSWWVDDKAKNKTSTYILSCHSLEPKWSWRPRGYARYPANEWCLRSKEICSGQHTRLHSVFLHKRTWEHTCKTLDIQLIKCIAALYTGEKGREM